MPLLGIYNCQYIFNHLSNLKKIRILHEKITFRSINSEPENKLCLLDKSSILNSQNLIISTDETSIRPERQVVDTKLYGYEYVLIQKLLAMSLGIPLPITGACKINYGISMVLDGCLYQVFEKLTWSQRLKNQIATLAGEERLNAIDVAYYMDKDKQFKVDCFPIFSLPSDACFVIRNDEIDKLYDIKKHSLSSQSPSSRISTPVSRLLWLACKNNNLISPLIKQPYKLVSIFEQWALTEGITDRLSGDTLKNALERGSPSCVGPSS